MHLICSVDPSGCQAAVILLRPLTVVYKTIVLDLDTDWIRIQGHWNRIRTLSGPNAYQQNESTPCQWCKKKYLAFCLHFVIKKPCSGF